MEDARGGREGEGEGVYAAVDVHRENPRPEGVETIRDDQTDGGVVQPVDAVEMVVDGWNDAR